MKADFLPFGGCYTTDDYAGSAIWAPAGKPMLTGLAGLLTMVPVLPYVVLNLGTTLRMLALVERLHPRQPHWYLASLGTAVERQGQGVGSASHWFMNAAIALEFPVVVHAMSTATPFVFFSVMTAVQFVVVLLFYPETKGQTLEELQRKLLRA